MHFKNVLLRSNMFLLLGSATGFAQTALSVRWFGAEELGYVIIVLAQANIFATFFEIISSEKVVRLCQSNPETRGFISQFFLLVVILIALAATFLVNIYQSAGLFLFALMMAFAQYGINSLYVADGRSHLAHYATFIISCFRLILILMCLLMGVKESGTLIYIYISTGAGVYFLSLAIEAIRYKKMPSDSNVSYIKTLKSCHASWDYVLMVGSKKLRESALGLLGDVGLFSQNSVGYISLIYKGSNFVQGHMRVLEVALMNKKHYDAYEFSRARALQYGIYGSLASAVFSFLYLVVSGISPAPLMEILIFSLIALPIALNQRLRVAAFHRQAFMLRTAANFSGAVLMLGSPIVFIAAGLNGAIGYALGCLLAEIALSIILSAERRL